MIGLPSLQEVSTFEQSCERPYSGVVERNQSASGVRLGAVPSNFQRAIN